MIKKARHVTRVGKRNQVTIPAAMLRALDVAPGTFIEVAIEDGEIRLSRMVDPVDRAYGLLKRVGAPSFPGDELERVVQESNRKRAERAFQRDIATKSRACPRIR